MSEDFDRAYREVPDFFGSLADPLLERHWGRMDPARPVLDVGAGQGRNALFLARNGIAVDAIDPSGVAARIVAGAAEAEGLPVRSFHADAGSFTPDRLPYGAVLLFGLLPILSPEAIARLMEQVRAWAAPGGLLFVTAFTTEDASHARCAAEWKRQGRNSFVNPEGSIRTFLEPGEILALLPEWSALHHWEGQGPEHRHGDGPPERHAMAEAVLRRPD